MSEPYRHNALGPKEPPQWLMDVLKEAERLWLMDVLKEAERLWNEAPWYQRAYWRITNKASPRFNQLREYIVLWLKSS